MHYPVAQQHKSCAGTQKIGARNKNRCCQSTRVTTRHARIATHSMAPMPKSPMRAHATTRHARRAMRSIAPMPKPPTHGQEGIFIQRARSKSKNTAAVHMYDNTVCIDMTGFNNGILIAYGMCPPCTLPEYYQMAPEHQPTHFMRGEQRQKFGGRTHTKLCTRPQLIRKPTRWKKILILSFFVIFV